LASFGNIITDVAGEIIESQLEPLALEMPPAPGDRSTDEREAPPLLSSGDVATDLAGEMAETPPALEIPVPSDQLPAPTGENEEPTLAFFDDLAADIAGEMAEKPLTPLALEMPARPEEGSSAETGKPAPMSLATDIAQKMNGDDDAMAEDPLDPAASGLGEQSFARDESQEPTPASFDELATDTAEQITPDSAGTGLEPADSHEQTSEPLTLSIRSLASEFAEAFQDGKAPPDDAAGIGRLDGGSAINQVAEQEGAGDTTLGNPFFTAPREEALGGEEVADAMSSAVDAFADDMASAVEGKSDAGKESESAASSFEKEPETKEIAKEPETEDIEKDTETEGIEKESETEDVAQEPKAEEFEREPEIEEVAKESEAAEEDDFEKAPEGDDFEKDSEAPGDAEKASSDSDAYEPSAKPDEDSPLEHDADASAPHITNSPFVTARLRRLRRPLYQIGPPRAHPTHPISPRTFRATDATQRSKQHVPPETLKGRAIALKPLPELADSTYDELLDDLSAERESLVKTEDFRRLPPVARAISHVEASHLTARQVSVHRQMLAEHSQDVAAIAADLRSYDSDTHEILEAVDQQHAEHRMTLESAQTQDTEQLLESWRSPRRFQQYNHAPNYLIVRRMQYDYYLHHGEYTNAELCSAELRAAEQHQIDLASHQMQVDFRESRRRAKIRHNDQKEGLEVTLQTEKQVIAGMREVERGVLERTKKKVQYQGERIRDPELAWNLTRPGRMNDISKRIDPDTQPLQQLPPADERHEIRMRGKFQAHTAPIRLPPLDFNRL
jgi:hypothetical protein